MSKFIELNNQRIDRSKLSFVGELYSAISGCAFREKIVFGFDYIVDGCLVSSEQYERVKDATVDRDFLIKRMEFTA